MTRKVYSMAVLAFFIGAQSVCAQTPDQINESLKRSQFCSRAAMDFFARPEWRSGSIADTQSYTSHFNKSLNKCLVNVRQISLIRKSNEILEMNHVYDALEGRALGGKILTKKRIDGEEKVISIVLVKEGRFIREPSEAAAVIVWFDRLMED